MRTITRAVLALATVAFLGCGGGEKTPEKPATPEKKIDAEKAPAAATAAKEAGEAAAQFANPDPSKCPVSGEEIDPEVTAVVNGKTYVFCCESCVKKFKEDPAKYLSGKPPEGS